MTKSFRSQIMLAAAVLLAGSMCFAEDGAAIYKSKCAMCHGPTGTPSAGMAKMHGHQARLRSSDERLSPTRRSRPR